MNTKTMMPAGDREDALRSVTAAVDLSFALTPERAAKLMKERAEKLAQVIDSAQTDGDLEIATFMLSNEKYAIESRHIREITPYKGCTFVPGAPDFIAGVINNHGQIVALVDLRRLFGLPHNSLISESAKVIVLGGDRTEFAIVAECVEKILRLNRAQLQESPNGSDSGRNHVLGVTSEALVVLDGAALIRDKRLFINQAGD